MLINFNIEKLKVLLHDFYTLTGMTISIWDAQFNQLSFQPTDMIAFCSTVKQSDLGKKRCFECDKKLCTECAESGNPVTHYCHAGLIDTAVPIKFKDTVLGYVMFGQVTDGTEEDVSIRLKKLSRDLKIDYSLLQAQYDELKAYDREKIKAAANILINATRSLWLSDYVEIGYNTLASQIDDYIRKNLNGDLSLQTICSSFGISKNKLYEIAHEQFGLTIGDYIAKTRTEEAKRFLSTTDYPISRISALVGFDDYNYFTKFFKQHTGITPLKYRKQFPFNLQDK